MSEQLLIRMPKKTKTDLKKEAERRQLSVAALIRQIVLDYLYRLSKGAA
jgi:predicted HicB family RNase H-like nuclease